MNPPEQNLHWQGFTQVFTKPVVLHKPIPDDNIRVLNGDYKRIFIMDSADLLNNEHQNNHFHFLHNIPKTVFVEDYIRFTSYNMDCIIYPYLNWKTQEEMQHDEIRDLVRRNPFLQGSYQRASIVAKLEKRDEQYFMCYYMNNKIIDNIKEGKREGRLRYFLELVTRQKKQELISETVQTMQRLLAPPTLGTGSQNTISDKVLKSSVNLYSYQKQDIEWMLDLTERIDTNSNVIEHNFPLTVTAMNDDFILFNGNVYPAWIMNEHRMTTNTKLQFYGGNLVSQVGLGKTIISLYYVFYVGARNRDAYNPYVRFGSSCNYTYKRGLKSGNACNIKIDENGEEALFCKTHSKTPFIDKRVIKFQHLDDFNFRNFCGDNENPNAPLPLKTNASLIICPNQLCD
jgi:hypothetical protein